MSGFFEEVKRRKVYRVAVAYVIAAGGIIQLASAAFPAWELPNWSLRLVIVLLLIGFPIALILAWAFDVTSQGIKATPSVAAPGSHLRRNVIMLVATGIIISAAAGFFLLPRASARKIDKSIAVLPFENLSDEKENAYFADGMQDDIMTNLSKIGDLKVISRTSVTSYRGTGARNAREIGKTLGVATLLEGSVRRIGNRVRVNVQLINADTDEHLGAEDYDRDLTDVFAIQTDLAQKIASELRAKLSPSEKAQFERRPTENGEAYLAFVQAHNLSGAFEDFDKLKQGEQLYARAIELDPNFALAMARYSQLESWFLHTFDRTPQRREKARTLAARALQLQPDLPEAHLAIAEKGDFSVAEKAFEAAKSTTMTNEQKLRIAGGRVEVFLLERKYKEGLQAAESLPDDQLATAFHEALGGKYYYIGFARKSLQDQAGARVAFLKAKSAVEEDLKRSPDSAEIHIQLAKVLAYLGEKDSALAEAQRAAELLPESKDAFGGPEITEEVAHVHAVLGNNARAIEILDGLLSRPSSLTVPGLKINPIWD